MNNTKISIAAILTCHNRKEKTLTCLTDLMNQDIIDDIELNVYLVDDGSTDGTSDAVMHKFSQINMLKGDGTLYWNGGMRLAYSEAMKNDYDYYLWLNDDTFLYSNAIKVLLETSSSLKNKKDSDVIVTGTIKEIETGEVIYGGRNKKSKLQPLKFILLENSTVPQQCDTFNGNVVLIPRNVNKEIGNISSEFSKQHGGDFDYGLRAKYAGFESWVASGFTGECASNTIEGTLFDKKLSLKERRKKMNTPQGVPTAKEWMIFTKRHTGILWPVYWLKTIVRVLFPWTYLYLRKPRR